MRWLFIASMIAGSASAGAQLLATPSERARADVERSSFIESADSHGRQYASAEPYRPVRRPPEYQIERAGAWGRCVADAAPEQGRAFINSPEADPALRTIFAACLHRVGSFSGATQNFVRRAALIDAFRLPTVAPSPLR